MSVQRSHTLAGAPKTTLIGTSPERIEGKEKATGSAQYVDDLQFGPNLLHARLKRSPLAHARILTVDTGRARALPGVRGVVSGADFPGYTGLYLKDRRIFATDRVRYVGDPVAAVAADTPEIAERALALIDVEYEELPAVFDPEYGASSGAPLIHPDLADYEHVPFIFPQAGTNVSNWFKVRKGDLARGWAEADLVLEGRYQVPKLQHVPMETHVCVAQQDGRGKITLWSSSQSPFAQRNLIAKALGIGHSRLRVITPHVGGGFGSKAGLSIEGAAVALAMNAKGRPVKLRMTRGRRILYNLRAAGPGGLRQAGHDPGRAHHGHAEPLLLGRGCQHRVRGECHAGRGLQRERSLLRAEHPG